MNENLCLNNFQTWNEKRTDNNVFCVSTKAKKLQECKKEVKIERTNERMNESTMFLNKTKIVEKELE